MADEPTQQQGADGEEASNHSQLMAMMLKLQASIDKIGRSFDNKNRVYDLSEQTSSKRAMRPKRAMRSKRAMRPKRAK